MISHSSRSRVWVVAALWGSFGCAAASKDFRVVSTESRIEQGQRAAAVAAAPGAPAACELRLHLEQLPSNGVEGVPAGELGAIIAERTEGKKLINGYCIKRPGQELQLPARVMIAAPDGRPSLERFCNDEAESGYTVVAPGVEKEVKACEWNGIFHSSRPFTVSLVAGTGHHVGEYVDLLRIYRNGDLMAAWNRVSDQEDSSRVVITGNSLKSGAFAATHPPHLSPMDIRIVPHVDGLVREVELKLRDDRAQFLARLSAAFQAASIVALPPDSPEYASLACLRSSLKSSAQRISRAVSEHTLVEFDTACDVLTGGKPDAQPLGAAYRALKDRSGDEVDKLRAKAYSSIGDLRDAVVKGIPAQRRKLIEAFLAGAFKNAPLTEKHRKAIESCKRELVDRDASAGCGAAIIDADPKLTQLFETVSGAMKTLDADVKFVTGTADEAFALADRLATRAKDIATDTDTQAQIFNAFAQSLSAQGDPFEPLRDNPALLAGEQKIDLLYADKFQWFLFAPWNGVPIRVTGDTGGDLSAAVVVPFVDVLGGRYQWSRSRFSDLRAAIGIGYIQTEPVGSDEKRSAALPNLSVGLGTLKIGAGFALGEGFGNAGERLRIVVGADLFKLISGSNVEAL
jgi:hypothetical protein